jgi:DNA ligase-1
MFCHQPFGAKANPIQMTQLLSVSYRRGIHVPEAGLWLDPQFSADCAFVSHAHSDHFARHRLTICSEVTHEIMTARYGKRAAGAFLPVPLGEPLRRGNWTLRLLPAGHIAGSSMLHLRREADGASLLYTGDYKLRYSRSCELARFEQADTLVMETTFALPHYRFPPRTKIIEEIHEFLKSAFESGATPVFYAYSLGKAQELLCTLADTGYYFMLHRSVWEMTRALAPHLSALPAYECFDPSRTEGKVLVFPPASRKSQALRKLKKTRTAMLTGWALSASAKYRYDVDEVIPLSDHADYNELLETVALVNPKRVFLVHGYTQEFAIDLRARGYDARALGRHDQMELNLGLSRSGIPNA